MEKLLKYHFSILVFNALGVSKNKFDIMEYRGGEKNNERLEL
ncbi:MAG: hypothetical protein ACKVOQ_19065 [Cyclobacteriaceae bacterium]